MKGPSSGQCVFKFIEMLIAFDGDMAIFPEIFMMLPGSSFIA
jgi:hypothetical protein